MTSETALDRVRDALEAAGSVVRGNGTQLSAQCPAHDDGAPSLSVGYESGKVLISCKVGCAVEDVLDALNLAMGDLFDEEPDKPRDCDDQYHRGLWRTERPRVSYPYTDEHGQVLYYQRRFACPKCGDPKVFIPYNPTSKSNGLPKGVRVLYRLPEVLAAAAQGRTVYVVEGEKDADRLAKLGHVATTAANGAEARWEQSYTDALKGADVVVIADNDTPGITRARTIAGILGKAGRSVRVLQSPLTKKGADVSDHLDAGHDLDALVPVTEDDGPDDAEERPPRRVRSQPITQITRRRRQYLWENRLPLGEVTLWVGHAGIGKSQGAVWLAAQVSRGELPGELHGTPSPVLYLGTEDSWEYTLAPRFDAAGADPTQVFRIYVETEEGSEATVSLAVDIDTLREEIAATGARLVILDALLSTFGSAKLTEQGTVRRHLEPLAQLAQELNIAVIGVAHFRKASDPNPLHMISGSAEFGQVVRSAIGFAADREADDGSCVLSLVKTNIAPAGLPSIRYRVESSVVDTDEGPTDVGRFVILGECDQNVGDLLNQENGSPEDRSERAEAGEWLLSYLADNKGEAIAGDVIKDAEKAGFAKHTIQRARKKVGVRSQKSGLKGGWAWVLPNDPDGAPEGDRVPEDDTKVTKVTGDQPQSPSSPSGGQQSPSGPDLGPDRQCYGCERTFRSANRDTHCIDCRTEGAAA